MGIMTFVSTFTTLLIFAALIVMVANTIFKYRTDTGGSVGGPLVVGMVGVVGAIISGALWVLTGFV